MNVSTITGRLVRDPELRSAGETSVVNFTVAVDGYNSRAKEKEADFIPCVVFGQQAEFLANYGTKGREIAVDGRLHSSSFEKDGQKRSKLELVVNRLELLGPRPEAKPQQGETEDFSLF